MLKKSWFVFRRTWVFYFLLFSLLVIFVSFCFCFFSFSFLKMILLLIVFSYVHCFFLHMLLHFFLIFDTTRFYQGFPLASISALKVAGLPKEVQNTEPTRLLVWSREIYLNLSKYVNNLLAVNNLIKFKHIN